MATDISVVPVVPAERAAQFFQHDVINQFRQYWSYWKTLDRLVTEALCSDHDPNGGPGSDTCMNCGGQALRWWRNG